MAKLYLALLVIGLLSGVGYTGYSYYMWSQDTIGTLRENNAKLKSAAETLQNTVDTMVADAEKNEDIKNKIEKNFDLSPRGIRELLGLNKPIYEVTSAYGHFGRKPDNNGQFSWEKTDKIDIFKK